ncbi:hypothetical protein LTR84_006251 [Exophiala bonariae]|uniref:NAD(P)-binding domain-containing protein n=1 Tax=Exophiala bonariae TaxID=1690606 RepID=A0AAV9N578_9EURO|nr:hypothetical protein LTR84_006251 [Exophiala bonariae]
MSSKPSVVFFGATGGVTNSALVHTIQAGYKAAVLVRTPAKLRQQLSDQAIDEMTIAKNLVLNEGNALDVAAVKRTLLSVNAGRLPTYIVSGLGGSPKLNLNMCHPLHLATLDNPEICATAASTLVTALEEIFTEQPALKANKPLLVFLSTTGVTRGPEDVPFAMRFLYHQTLAIPHADKKKMEDIYRGEVEKQDPVFRSVVGIRPTLLSGTVSYTDASGLQGVRSGYEHRPATGYSIKRADVGHWIFQNLIDEATRNPEVEGQMVSLTS